LNPDPPDLCLPSSYDYRCEPPMPGIIVHFKEKKSMHYANSQVVIMLNNLPPKTVWNENKAQKKEVQEVCCPAQLINNALYS
jgi:hypothetical protein